MLCTTQSIIHLRIRPVDFCRGRVLARTPLPFHAAMDHFNYKNGELYCEDVPAEKIAREVGTPVYVYSKATFLHHYRQIRDAFAAVNPTICYSIKSCGNINILKFLRAEGCGFDVTSGGELFRALEAGADPKKIIYAGVGKSDQEIADGINARIAAFN